MLAGIVSVFCGKPHPTLQAGIHMLTMLYFVKRKMGERFWRPVFTTVSNGCLNAKWSHGKNRVILQTPLPREFQNRRSIMFLSDLLMYRLEQLMQDPQPATKGISLDSIEVERDSQKVLHRTRNGRGVVGRLFR